MLQDEISVVGAGRTDTGVHASQMFAHFDVNQELVENAVFKLNSILPEDIVIHNVGGGLGKKNPLSIKQDYLDVWNFNVGVQIEINNKII